LAFLGPAFGVAQAGCVVIDRPGPLRTKASQLERVGALYRRETA